MVSGLRLPIVVAPIFLVSGPQLVVAAGRQGLIGSFPTAYPRTLEELERWFEEIERGLAQQPAGSAPYAANLIVHPTNERMDPEFDLICKHKVPIVIASVGNPARIVARVHDYGGVVLTDVARIDHARKAADRGVDGSASNSGEIPRNGCAEHCGTVSRMTNMVCHPSESEV